jgi:hypothetical protein
MSSIYKFEEDAQSAFRAILQLSSNYRALQEKFDNQENIIRDLTEQLTQMKNSNRTSDEFSTNLPFTSVLNPYRYKSPEIKVANPPDSVTKVYMPTNIDISNNTVGPEKSRLVIGPLECKTVKPTAIDSSNNKVGPENSSVVIGPLECKTVKPTAIDSSNNMVGPEKSRLVIGPLECKTVKPTAIDSSNNKVGPEKSRLVIGPLECKTVKPMVFDSSNILQDKSHKSYSGTKVGEPSQTMSRNIFRDRA